MDELDTIEELEALRARLRSLELGPRASDGPVATVILNLKRDIENLEKIVSQFPKDPNA